VDTVGHLKLIHHVVKETKHAQKTIHAVIICGAEMEAIAGTLGVGIGKKQIATLTETAVIQGPVRMDTVGHLKLTHHAVKKTKHAVKTIPAVMGSGAEMVGIVGTLGVGIGKKQIATLTETAVIQGPVRMDTVGHLILILPAVKKTKHAQKTILAVIICGAEMEAIVGTLGVGIGKKQIATLTEIAVIQGLVRVDTAGHLKLIHHVVKETKHAQKTIHAVIICGAEMEAIAGTLGVGIGKKQIATLTETAVIQGPVRMDTAGHLKLIHHAVKRNQACTEDYPCCDDLWCRDGGYCRDTRCWNWEEADCYTDRDCCDPRTCADGHCRSPETDPPCHLSGQACSEDKPCCDDLWCRDGGFCRENQCSDWEDASCFTDVDCCGPRTCVGHSCKMLPCGDAGQDCSIVECCDGLACNDMMCQSQRSLCLSVGMSCSQSEQCCGGLQCGTTGTCIPCLTEVGEDCTFVECCAELECNEQNLCAERVVDDKYRMAKARTCGEATQDCISSIDCCPGLHCNAVTSKCDCATAGNDCQYM
jgi:hypothetical protein